MLCYVKYFDLSEPEESHDQAKIFLAGQHDWQQFQIYLFWSLKLSNKQLLIILYYMQAPNRSLDDATDGNTEENAVEDSERDDANDTTEPPAPPAPPPGPSAATVAYNFVTSFFTSLFPTGPAVQNWFIGGDLLTRIETWNSMVNSCNWTWIYTSGTKPSSDESAQ